MNDEPRVAPHRLVLEASMSGDISELMSIFADDAILMPPNDSNLVGTEEIAAWWKEYFQWFRLRKSVETERSMTVAGTQAFQRSVISILIEPVKKGKMIQDEVRSLIVWRRDAAGQWKISHQMWNSSRPVGSGTNRYISRINQQDSGGA